MNNVLSYQEVIKRSKENIFLSHKPYNIEGDPSYYQLLIIYERWQGVLQKTQYGSVGDAGWIFVDNPTPFAEAVDSDKFRLVVCSTGLFHFINSLDTCLSPLITYNETYLKNFYLIQKHCSELFVELAFFFLFFHEYAHLRQFKLEEAHGKNSNQKLGENYFKLQSTQVEESHKKEFDADFFAAAHSAERLLVMWQGMDLSVRKRDILLTFCGLNIAVYTFMFFSLYRFSGLENEPFYLNSKSHPHPYVRMKYTIDAFKGKINDFDFGFEKLTSDEIEIESGKYSSGAFKEYYGINFETWTKQFTRHNPTVGVYCKFLEEITRRDNTKTIHYRT